MTRSNRDEFLESTKRVLAERAAYLCSKPDCRNLTVGPHSNPGKSLKDGIAAHICGAAPGGPRYDPNQTSEERKSIENGIWLCHNCSDFIDNDEQRYAKDVLRQWKQQHDAFVRQDGGIPLLPHIEIYTQAGLSVPSTGSFAIDSGHVERIRENVLSIENRSGRVLNYFQARIQFPEPVLGLKIFDQPPGENVVCEPDRMNLIAVASGEGASVTGLGSRPAFDYKLQLGSLPPRSRVEIHFSSVKPDEFGSNPTSSGKSEEAHEHYIRGEFQYPLMGEYLQRGFLVLMNFDESTRVITSQVCEDDDGSKQLIKRMLFW